ALADMKTRVATSEPEMEFDFAAGEATRITANFDPHAPDRLPPPPSRTSSPFGPPPTSPFEAPVTGVNTLPDRGSGAFNLVLIAGLLCFAVVVVAALAWLLLSESGPTPPVASVPEVTSIVIQTEPVQQVEVLLDGELKATRTPFEVRDVKPGSHEIEIRHDAYEVAQRSIILNEGEQKTVVLTLERKPEGKGQLKLTLDPPEASVFVDGKVQAPTEGAGVYALELSDRNEHLVEAYHPGRVTEELRVRVSDGQRITKSMALRSAKGRIDLKSQPSGTVYLDGVRVGRSPQLISDLETYRAYELEIRQAGYASWKKRVVFHRSFQKTFSATLRRKGAGDADPNPEEVGYLSVKSPATWWRVNVGGWEDGGLVSPIPSERKLTLPVGEHTITFRRGDQTHTRTVTIRPEETATVEITDDFQW
ncbi:MAG: PEGA domain-containing protein, partial [Myxococcota bacterium]